MMWQFLENAAKNVTTNASEYVSTVQERAQTLVTSVQSEAATLLQSLSSENAGPVDEILYEELDAYYEFLDSFYLDQKKDEIASILEKDEALDQLHTDLVPDELSEEEFWRRYFFRRHEMELRQQRIEERERQQEEARSARNAMLQEFAFHTDEEVETEEQEESEKLRALASESFSSPEDLRSVVEAAVKAKDEAVRKWRQRVMTIHQHLEVVTAQHEDAIETLQQEQQKQYQNLVHFYESKTDKMKVEMDAARAAGYEEGTKESEGMIESLKEAMSVEQTHLKGQLTKLQQELEKKRENEESDKTKEQGGEKEEAEELKKQVEVWRVRAIKMKKLKEKVEKEKEELGAKVSKGSTEGDEELRKRVKELEERIEQLQGDVQTAYDRGVSAAEEEAQQRIDELTERLNENQARLEQVEEVAYEEGMQAGKSEMDHEVNKAQQELILKLQEDITSSYDTGVATAKAEVDLLTSELALLRAERHSSVASQPSDLPPVPSSDANTVASGKEPELDVHEALAGDKNDRVETVSESDGKVGGKSGTQDDWGEW